MGGGTGGRHPGGTATAPGTGNPRGNRERDAAVGMGLGTAPGGQRWGEPGGTMLGVGWWYCAGDTPGGQRWGHRGGTALGVPWWHCAVDTLVALRWGHPGALGTLWMAHRDTHTL